MKPFIFLALLVISVMIFPSCGSSKKTAPIDPGLEALLGDKDYNALTPGDKYEIAQYFLRRGNINRARTVYEDILARIPSAYSIKYKLATLYLEMDTVYFITYDKKGRPVSAIFEMGSDLGTRIIEETRSNHPDFLPVYSTALILAMQKEDTGAIRKIYTTAKEKDPAYSLADYRVGYLSIWDLSNPNRYNEGIAAIKKAQTSFRELYEAYKQLGNIQKVQGMDTLAYASYQKALKYRTEAYDLFDLYYELADVCFELFRKRGVEKFKTEALDYACQSLQYFEGYKPSAELIRSITGKGGEALPDSIVAREAAAFCRSYKKD